jgi:hypothetical protein
LAAFWLLAHSISAAPLKKVRRVLILHALGFSPSASILVDQEIRATLDKAPYQIELYSESMQGILFSDPASQRELAQGYIRKYRDRRPDVVIAVSRRPIKFMAQSGEKFGPTTPVVICASSEDQLEGVKLDSRFTKVGDLAFGTDDHGAGQVGHPAGNPGAFCLRESNDRGQNKNRDEHGALHQTSPYVLARCNYLLRAKALRRIPWGGGAIQARKEDGSAGGRLAGASRYG